MWILPVKHHELSDQLVSLQQSAASYIMNQETEVYLTLTQTQERSFLSLKSCWLLIFLQNYRVESVKSFWANEQNKDEEQWTLFTSPNRKSKCSVSCPNIRKETIPDLLKEDLQLVSHQLWSVVMSSADFHTGNWFLLQEGCADKFPLVTSAF